MKKMSLILTLLVIFLFPAANVFSHCEIPCGIYDDAARIKLIAEHITTIENSMKQISAIEKQKSLNHNQLVRWISNKEKHADEIQTIVSQYFMTQRIKPDSKDYLGKLKLLHQMLIYAMKCKQTIDIENAEKLRVLLADFQKAYLNP